MIESVVSLIGATTMNAILLVGAAGAQVQEKSRNETVVTNPEARIAELERGLAAASKEVQELRQELDAKSKTVAIRLAYVDVSYAVEQLIMVAGNNPSTKIVLDKASNTIFASGPPLQVQQAKEILHEIEANFPELRAVVLKHAKASEAAKIATALVKGERDLTLIPDDRTNTVIIRANTQNFAAAEIILKRLDVPGK